MKYLNKNSVSQQISFRSSFNSRDLFQETPTEIVSIYSKQNQGQYVSLYSLKMPSKLLGCTCTTLENQLKLLHPYCACHTKKEMRSRDTTVLIDFQWFNVAHYSSLFQYFFSIYYGAYSSWKFLIFLVENS